MQNPLRRPLLLVIADSVPLRAWIKKNLHDQFFILDATTQSAALETILHTALDFIILDSNFGDCDPLILCREMKPLLHSSLTPILFITGRLKKTYREAALEAGVTDFLSDQLDMDELETRVATGRKAVAIRQKTVDVSAALQMPKSELSENYLKTKLVLHDQALRFILQAKTTHLTLSLLLIRIDRFEEFQTKFGYGLADELLLLLSKQLQRHLNMDHLFIPSADNSLIILLRNVSTGSVKTLAETLRRDVEQHPFIVKQQTLHFTISIAYSPIDANETAFNQTIRAAIQSLAQAQMTSNTILSLEKENL